MELNEELSEELTQGISEEETTPELTQGTEQVEPTQDVANQQSYWQEHENAKKGFWKSEQDVIKGYDYYDKKFRPIETVLKQRGIKDHDGLNEILGKYDEYSSPDSEINKSHEALQNLLNHPQYGQEFQKFVSQIVENEEKQRYGTTLTPEMRQQQQELAELKQWREQQEYKQNEQKFIGELDKIENQINDFCKSKGIELGADEFKEHLQFCLENEVGINQVYDKFITRSLDKILENVQSKASKAVVNNIQTNSKASVASSSRNASTVEKAPGTISELNNAMKSIFMK